MSEVVQFSEFQSKSPRPKSPLTSTSPTPVEPLFGTLERSIRRIRAEMLSEECSPEHRWLRSVRPYRQKFCKLTREFSGHSLEEMCEGLNQHPDILKLKPYPSFNSFYPITPDFISNLENDIGKIFEYCAQGFAFGGIGVPTEEIAKAIADICESKKEYKKFWLFVKMSG